MDSSVVKILNLPIYGETEDEEGNITESEEPTSYRIIYVPSKIHSDSIVEIYPKITTSGKLYKNVSTVRTTEERFDIIGNYIKENKRLFPTSNKIGYK